MSYLEIALIAVLGLLLVWKFFARPCWACACGAKGCGCRCEGPESKKN